MIVFALFAASLFTDQLWTEIKPIYAQTLEHPFLKGLTSGKLPQQKFRFYIEQDELYLRAFGQALSIVASKAPRPDWAVTLSQHATSSIKSEHELHVSILKTYPDAKRATQAAPSNYAYINHFMVAAERGTFAEGLSALLPCYWIYLEVGRELKRQSSPDPNYKKWIDNYAGDEYAKEVKQVLDMMNEEATKLTPEQRKRVIDLFVTSTRYEYMFWDMAWREERWPPQ